jgi:hypothetical protein
MTGTCVGFMVTDRELFYERFKKRSRVKNRATT